jgi:hypothetical protein
MIEKEWEILEDHTSIAKEAKSSGFMSHSKMNREICSRISIHRGSNFFLW